MSVRSEWPCRTDSSGGSFQDSLKRELKVIELVFRYTKLVSHLTSPLKYPCISNTMFNKLVSCTDRSLRNHLSRTKYFYNRFVMKIISLKK